MDKFHVVTGVPRSGSTLLCNVLNQNPKFYAGSTSPLPELISAFINQTSNSMEIKAALAVEGDVVSDKIIQMVKGMVESWHSDRPAEVVFDKSRGWAFSAILLNQIYPNVKFVTCVRDLRNVFGSVEKQHRKTPMFDLATNPNEKTMLSKADTMLAPEGMIGQPVVGIQDMMARISENVFIMHYEAFSMDPRTKMMELYEFLDESYYEHDFDNVENVSTDLDALHLNKFPHIGEGRVKPTNRAEWQKYVSPELGGLIYNRYPNYNTMFGYQ
jgi:sulfotransferase